MSWGMNLSTRGEDLALSLKQKEPRGVVKQGSQSVIICSQANTHTLQDCCAVTFGVIRNLGREARPRDRSSISKH